MGFTSRGVTYNSGTNTLSGFAVQDQDVHIHVDGKRGKGDFVVRSAKSDGAWSMVLTGLALGAHTVNVSLNETSRGQSFFITKV